VGVWVARQQRKIVVGEVEGSPVMMAHDTDGSRWTNRMTTEVENRDQLPLPRDSGNMSGFILGSFTLPRVGNRHRHRHRRLE
jgi:hypothetical protein